MAMSDPAPVAAAPQAHVAICPRCETPSLPGDLPDDTPGMQCPDCGFKLRTVDLNTYVLQEGDGAE